MQSNITASKAKQATATAVGNAISAVQPLANINAAQASIEGLLFVAFEALFALQAAVNVQAPQHVAAVSRTIRTVDKIAVQYNRTTSKNVL